MIQGRVRSDGTPIIFVPIGGESWTAVIDTGFNGDLELPDAFRQTLNPCYQYPIISGLGGGQNVVEDAYEVDFPFDGRIVLAEATFVSSSEILIGTRLLRDYRLQIDFPKRTVAIERAT
jgi:predicted aspartyl protease